MKNVLVVGASRGLGLGFVAPLLARGCSVIATQRKNTPALTALVESGDLEMMTLDVAVNDSLEAFFERIGDRPIDTVIHNAGIYGPSKVPVGELPHEAWMEVLKVDTVAPLMVTQRLLGNLRAATDRGDEASIHFVTSRMGSIQDNTSGGSYLYRSAKAGLNAAGRSLAIDLADDGIAVQLIHPGWVRTDMGSDNAPLSVEESVAGMLECIDSLTMAESGRFIDQCGKTIPW